MRANLKQALMIPPLNDQGYLPEGVHECTIEEVTIRFGTFQVSDRRPRLWAKFAEFLDELKTCDFLEAVLVDGSFVTGTQTPNDIDLILVVTPGFDFSVELSPSAYNSLSQRRVRSRFGFDIVVVKDGSETYNLAVTFFQQVKQRSGFTKGILRIAL